MEPKHAQSSQSLLTLPHCHLKVSICHWKTLLAPQQPQKKGRPNKVPLGGFKKISDLTRSATQPRHLRHLLRHMHCHLSLRAGCVGWQGFLSSDAFDFIQPQLLQSKAWAQKISPCLELGTVVSRLAMNGIIDDNSM